MNRAFKSCLLIVASASLASMLMAQEEQSRPRIRTGQTFRSREQKVLANIDGQNVEKKLVNWSYLRLNQPLVIKSFLLGVKSGKVSPLLLKGLAPKMQLDAMVGRVRAPIRLKVDKETAKPATKPAEDKGLKFVDLFPVQPIQKTDVGSVDLGQFPVGNDVTYNFEGTAQSSGQLKFTSLSKDWHIVKAATLTGEIDAKGNEKVQQQLVNPTGQPTLPIKAGQDFRITIAVKPSAAKDGPGDSLGSWVVEGGGVAYSGSVVAHYYENSIGVVGQADVAQLVQGKGNYANATVRNDTPIIKTITVEAIEAPNGVSVASQTVTLNPHETRKLNLTVSVAGDSPEVRNVPIHLRGTSNDGVTGDGYVRANIYLPFYTWSDGGSCGKIDFNSSVTVGSNGLWQWQGHMHDNSTWYGDDYSYAFFFNRQRTGGGNLGLQDSGTLGAKYSGPAVDYDFNHSGSNSDIAAHFEDYVNNGYSWHISVGGDIGQVLKPIGEWLVAHGVSLIALA